MPNRIHNKQVSPKGFMKGGRAKKMGFNPNRMVAKKGGKA